ncbi:MAG: hypothetical protein J6X83_01985 [Methanomicrobium sp.]|nr:hypothetical protein [Methanomicrobium sp.]
MTRDEAIRRIWDTACEIAETGNFGAYSEIDSLAYDFEIYLDYDDDAIYIEDDSVYFQY